MDTNVTTAGTLLPCPPCWEDFLHILAARAAIGHRVLHLDELVDMDEHFDVVIALEVHEHLLDPAGSLGSAVAVPRSGGSALISVLNAFSWWNRIRMLVGRLPASGVGPPGLRNHTYDSTRFRFFDLASLGDLIARTGLECKEFVNDTLDLGRFANASSDRFWPLTPQRAIFASNLVARRRKR